MRYASVCDGIGAAHVAWQSLGWSCLWTSEIEPFPAAVVEQRFGFVNVGDMTKITEETLNAHGPVDLLVGGTPCQSFSVAGLRGGLADPRGNLALRFVQIAAVMQPKWIVWENVPGVLSSGKGRDFGTFLGALGELGYGFAYRVLDAQWFGVAQRRRRVFVVGHLGDWRRAAAVLFERESVFGNPPTRGAKGERTTGPIAGCSNGGGANGPGRTADDADSPVLAEATVVRSFPPEVSPALKARDFKGPSSDGDGDGASLVPIAFQGGSQQDQVLSGEAVCPALCHSSNGNKGHHQPKVVVPFTKSKRAQSTTDDETWVPGDVSPTMSCFDQGDTRATTVVAFTQNSRDEVRQINGDGQIAGALSADAGMHQTNYVAFDILGTPATNAAKTTDVHVPLRARQPGQSEASTTTVVACNNTGAGWWNEPEEVAATVRRECDRASVMATALVQTMAVRRLTPRECERLQGFPDDYTLVEYRKKPVADGPRYRALGNSMAVPVMRWIGERIAKVEAIK